MVNIEILKYSDFSKSNVGKDVLHFGSHIVYEIDIIGEIK